MENKEVEDALFYISEKARREPYTDPELIVNYHRGIGGYIELLEQQLQAKDKALDKACGKIEYECMSKNKEECEQSLIELTPNPIGIYSDDVMMIRKLINVHFDNPPLKFEELHEGMWVWDKPSKVYTRWIGYYAPNRFYRYEVKDV